MAKMIVEKSRYVSNHELMRRGSQAKLGFHYETSTQMMHKMKCVLCGNELIYNRSDVYNMIEQGRWDFRKDKPKHCHRKACYDYEEECRQWAVKRGNTKREEAWELFLKLKREKIIV